MMLTFSIGKRIHHPTHTTGLHGELPGGDLLRRVVNRGRVLCRKLPPTTATIVTGGTRGGAHHGDQDGVLSRAGYLADCLSGINAVVGKRKEAPTLPVSLARHA